MATKSYLSTRVNWELIKGNEMVLKNDRKMRANNKYHALSGIQEQFKCVTKLVIIEGNKVVH